MGRHVELRFGVERLRALPGEGGAFLLVGDAGVGKTAIVESLVSTAVDGGQRVCMMTASESEAVLPFAALQQILHAFSSQLPLIRERPRNVLGRAFGSVQGDPPDVFAVGIAVLEALADVAPASGLVVVVDDAQWLDDATARVLAFVARRLDSDPVLMIFACREGLPSPLREAGLPTLQVAPLPAADARMLLQQSRPRLTVEGREAVLRFASGNPLGLLELPEQFDPRNDASLTGRLRDTFLARAGLVSDIAAAVALAAALNDGGAVDELEFAGLVLGFDQDATAGALEELRSNGIVEVTAGRVAFRHPLVRSAVASSAAVKTRRRIHAALAAVVRNDPDRALWHRAASVTGRDEGVAAELTSAAERAALQGDVAASLRAWQLAADLSASASTRSVRLVRTAEAALQLGRPETSVTALSGVDRRSLNDVMAVRFDLVQLMADPHAADVQRLSILTTRADAMLRAGEVDLAIELMLTVDDNLSAGGYDGSLQIAGLVAQVVEALEPDDPRRLIVQAIGDPGRYADAVVESALQLDPGQLFEQAALITRVTRFHVDADKSLARLDRALLDGYRANGSLRSIVALQPVHAWIEICLADWSEAVRSAEEGTRLATELGLPRWGTGTTVASALVAAVRGDHDQADDLIHEAEQGAIASGAHNVLTGVQLTKGINHLAQGQYDEAFSALRRVLDPDDITFHPVQSPWVIGDLAEAAAHLGRTPDVQHILAGSDGWADTPWRRMAQAYAEPFLTDDGDADAAFRAALTGVVSSWPAYHARLLVAYGSWLRRHRRIAEARDRLQVGRDLADALLLHPWSERAAGELRALGAASRPRVITAWESLSPQELEVAQLAAQGMSNREIGERLFLSHRTVGSHLYRIFPKLGIANRAQLTAALRSPATLTL